MHAEVGDPHVFAESGGDGLFAVVEELFQGGVVLVGGEVSGGSFFFFSMTWYGVDGWVDRIDLVDGKLTSKYRVREYTT